jgi:hypothetical protein
LPSEDFEAFDEAGKATFEGPRERSGVSGTRVKLLSMELMWGKPAMTLQMKVDPDRANLSGVTNLDLALSSTAAMSGLPVAICGDGDKHFVTPLLVPALYSMFVLDLTFYLRRFS